MPFIDTARGGFAFRQTAGTNPILFFLHGNLGSSGWWQPTFDLLPDDWRAVAPDAIGFGESERPEGFHRFSVAALVQDLAAFVYALQLPFFHLIAHSTATPVAIEFALAFPDLVASLVLVDPVPTAGITTPPEAYPYLEKLGEDQTLRTQALRSSLPGLDHTSTLFSKLLEQTKTIAPEAYIGIARGIDKWRPQERLRQLTLPVLLMRGELDIMLSETDAQRTLISIPGAGNLDILHRVGHGPMVENPQGFAQPLIDFINEETEAYQAIRESVDE